MDIVPQIITNSITAGSVYALIAMGFSLVYGTTKFFNLTHGVLTAIGGYVVLYASGSLGLPLPIAIVLGIAVAALIGWGTEIVIYRPLRNRKGGGLPMLNRHFLIPMILLQLLIMKLHCDYRNFFLSR